MFREEWEWDEIKVRQIRSLGDTEGGKLLSAYIENEIQNAFEAVMTRVDASDSTSIAYAQAQRNFGHAIFCLLNQDVTELLQSYNQEQEEEDEAGD